MEGEINNLIKVWLMVLASLLYCHFISIKLSKGKLRLFSLLPIFSLFTILPLQLSSVMPTGITAMSFTWLCNFKLLLFAFDQGPLIPSNDQDPPLPLLQFIAIACLPVKIRQNHKHPSHQNHKLPLNWPAKVVIFAVLVGILNVYFTQLHPKLVLIMYCFVLYFLVDVIFGVCNSVMMFLGMELEPPSDEPYYSSSLQDFWGRRWNLVITNTLRHTIYKPVKVFSEYWVGKQWALLPAVLSSFLVSGLMHELIFYEITRTAPTWEVTWYFLLHGLCLVVEFGVKKLVADRWRLHWVVSSPLTVRFVVVIAAWLFFPPMTRTGADVRTIEETKMLINFLKERLQVLKDTY